MQEHKIFHDYLEKVCEQIRWKKAHTVVRKELHDHLEDQQEAFIASGATVDEAAGNAVRDMGDALLVGTQLDRAYRPRPAWGVIAVTIILMILGYFARGYVARYANRILDINTPPENVLLSLFFLCIAIAVLIAGYFLDYTILGKNPLIIGVGVIIVVIGSEILFPLFNIHDINGMSFGAYFFTRYITALIPVIYAAILWWWPYRGYTGLILCYLVIAATAFWGLYIPSLLAFFYCAFCGILLTVEMLKGRFKIKKTNGLLILYVPVISFLIWLFCGPFSSSVMERLTPLFNPWVDPMGRGFMAVQMRKALAASKWIGTGSHTIEHVPSLVNDLTLTFYIHQFGWISLVVVLLLFGALFVFSVLLLKRQKSKLGRMVGAAILSSLALQCAIYLINNLFGWITTSTLPLVSYSNVALIIDSFLIGLLLSVFRLNDVANDTAIKPKIIPRFKITFERIG